jgi:arsenate reductase (thioredoxin)
MPARRYLNCQFDGSHRNLRVTGQPFRILFLSQRNAARSIMAEAIANSVGGGQLAAFSAGVRPAPKIDPLALELLQQAGISPPAHPPQHVREFSAPDSPPLDFVLILSDTAAGEAPDMWPGQPITAHWNCTDPEQFDDALDRRQALIRTRKSLERRLRSFANLPVRALDRMSLQSHLEQLGLGTDA